jgi:DNA-binding CsgD family transcriptional regulator
VTGRAITKRSKWREGAKKLCAREGCGQWFSPEYHDTEERWKVRPYCSRGCARAMQILTPWTKEKVDELIRLITEGRTNQQIADLMGTTYHAVVGKRDRLNMGAKASAVDRRSYADTGRIIKNAALRNAEEPYRPPPLDPKEGKGCRFILDEPRRYCGERTVYAGKGRSGNWVWCAEHRAVVYEPPRPRKAKEAA